MCKSPLRLVFLLFFTFTNAMLVFGFFLVTILSSGKTTYTVSDIQLTYSLLLGGLVLQGFISSHLLIMCIHIEDLPGWFGYIRWVLRIYPPFNFSTAFFEISRRSSWHPLYTERRWAPGEGYAWEHFYEPQQGFLKQHSFVTPSLSSSLWYLCIDIAGFAVLAWFCDNVVASNRGVGQPVWFLFTRRYWGLSSLHKDSSYQTSELKPQSRDSVEEETERVKFLQRDGTGADGIQVVNLSKVYRKYPLGCKSINDVVALSGLYLTAERDEVLTLLGHNGAGKSTLLSILSGTLSPSSGSAYVCGLDIRQNMSEIRKKMGFCPQHSLLWDELTAEEHVYLFSRLKGLSPSSSQKSTTAILHEVELAHVSQARIATFSGGMRRRISIALAATGNPDVILMDEPTTGLDPISRSQVWKLVHRFKRNRVVILTTHSMEEADALSDRIAVLVSGSLTCIGTSLFLKNRFGAGYRVSVLTHVREEVRALITAHTPAATIQSETADSLIVGLPKDDLDTQTKFFHMIETGALKELVDDWGISNTTLEQVFLKVTEGKSGN